MVTAENIWKNLIKSNNPNQELSNKLWSEIHKAYSSKGRYYHTIKHIEKMLEASLKYGNKLQDINNIQMAVFYHDIVYIATRSDNEELSADYAKKHLKEIGFKDESIKKCCVYILATKGHGNVNHESDLNYFLDFDLEKLGASWDEYEEYSKQIRLEYKIYPQLIYSKGRRKVLKHFLSRQRIFKTEVYYELFEEQARKNMKKELTII